MRRWPPVYERQREDERDPTTLVDRPLSPAPPSQELLLRLQRSAGNAAVGRMVRARALQRQPLAPPPAPAPAPAPAPEPAVAEPEPGSFAALTADAKAKIEALKTAQDAFTAAAGAVA